MWLENCTVFTAQTSAPSRCKGNTALALPTWPKATQDWMERMFTPCSRAVAKLRGPPPCGNAGRPFAPAPRRAMLPATGVRLRTSRRGRASDEPADRLFPPRRDARRRRFRRAALGRRRGGPGPGGKAERAQDRHHHLPLRPGFGLRRALAAGRRAAGGADQPRRRHRRRAAPRLLRGRGARRRPPCWASTGASCRTRGCTSSSPPSPPAPASPARRSPPSCARPRCSGTAAPSASSRRASTPTPSAPRATARPRSWRRCSTC